MGCGCGGKRKRTVTAAGERVGYYVTFPDGTEMPKVSAGEAPFLSQLEAKVALGTGGGTIRTVRRAR